MIIKSIDVKKFRGFNDVKFDLGRNLTVIAGQNGTQKTTLLGMISQPFTITNVNNPMKGEKPLSGGDYKSMFSKKFKLSENFDTPGKHEWTLNFFDESIPEFTLESIKRDPSAKEKIRFWQKGNRKKDSGYIQIPVIYLSLSRLFPIGEDELLDSSRTINLTDEETKFYNDWHNQILITDSELTGVDYLVSKQKYTLGANTSFYDWKMNSSGQDNLGKILLAIISFKRLFEKYGNEYRGGILAIDELDATLYPGSQIELITAFRKFSSWYNIQIIFTTHSLTILEKMCELNNDKKLKDQINIVYVKKIDEQVKITQGIDFDYIKNELHVSGPKLKKEVKRKITIFTEDNEAEVFSKCILKSKRTSKIEFAGGSLGCGNLLDLSRKEIKGFRFPDSIIILDGDSKSIKTNKQKNIIYLPGNLSPERLLADYLNKLLDSSELWENICPGYTKQFVFKDFKYLKIKKDRDVAKKWFIQQKSYWGKGSSRLINLWIADNGKAVDEFCQTFDELIKKYI